MATVAIVLEPAGRGGAAASGSPGPEHAARGLLACDLLDALRRGEVPAVRERMRSCPSSSSA